MVQSRKFIVNPVLRRGFWRAASPARNRDLAYFKELGTKDMDAKRTIALAKAKLLIYRLPSKKHGGLLNLKYGALMRLRSSGQMCHSKDQPCVHRRVSTSTSRNLSYGSADGRTDGAEEEIKVVLEVE